MKRTLILMSALLAVASCGFAQSLNKSEAKALQNFLSQPAYNGGTNGAQLGLQANNIAMLPGVKVAGGHVTEIEWKGKNLSGNLNLSNFPALQKVDVSGNKIVNLTLANNPALVDVNAGRNRITDSAIWRRRDPVRCRCLRSSTSPSTSSRRSTSPTPPASKASTA